MTHTPPHQPEPAEAAPPELEMFYVVFLKRGPAWTSESTPAIEKLQRQHLAYLRKLAKMGKLVIAGPLVDAPHDLRGLSVFRAESLAEAQALSEADPAVQAGRLAVEVMAWYAPAGVLPSGTT